jgi:hypothetical protein
MGRSITPTYRVEYQDNNQPSAIKIVSGSQTIASLPGSLHWKSMIWDKRDGRPTEENLEKWRRDYNRSFNPGGSNWHVSEAVGHVIHISKARIVRQKSGQVVATVRASMFEVV